MSCLSVNNTVMPLCPTFLLFSVGRILLSLLPEKINISLVRVTLLETLVLSKHILAMPLVLHALWYDFLRSHYSTKTSYVTLVSKPATAFFVFDYL